MKNILVFFALFILDLFSCSWQSMYLEPVSQPIYIGPLIIPVTESDSIKIDTLWIVSGKYIHVEEDESYVETEHVDISMGGEPSSV